MEAFALLLAATLNAGTVLAIAGLGLLINERAGIVNLGAEGMMLVAAIAGFATAVHTGSDWLAFAAGMGAGAVLAAAVRRAGDLAQHQPVRHRPGAEPVRRRLLGLRRHQVHAGEAGRAAALRDPAAGRHPVRRAGVVQAPPDRLPHRARHGGAGVVPVPLARRPGAARGRRVARVGACAGLPGAPHPPARGGGRRRVVRPGRRLHLGGLHAAVGGGHDRRQGLDRAGAHHLRHLAAGARAARAPTCSAASRCCSSTCRARACTSRASS